MKNRWFWLMWVVAGAQLARAEPVKLLPGPFVLPERIGPMTLNGEPHRYEDPALGASYQYFARGLSLTVYVYDLGIADIPDGGDSIPVCDAFEGAKREVMGAGYQDVVLKSEQLARLDAQADVPTMREAVFEFTRSGRPTVSYVWITGAAKLFVKLRFSVDPQLRDELPEARPAILMALGDAIKPYLAPVDPAAKESGANVVVNSTEDEKDMGLGLMYLMSISASAEQNPASMPVCGGELVPAFAVEVDAYQDLLAVANEAGKTKFSRRLAEVAAAGYLEEFLWTYRHRDSWGATAPAELELAAFDRWRKKKLKRFKMPVFGSVEFRQPRPLALEPPATP